MLRRLAEMAEKDSSLRQKQPWQAAYKKDNAWFSDTVVAHYNGDDSNVKVLLGGVLKAFGDMTVEAFAKLAADFMRPVTQTLYGVPPERVVGSAVKLSFQADDQGATIMRQMEIDFVDDGPAKAVHIWERIGRRPIFAAGNANGDIPMLQYTDTNAQSSLCLLVNHDDAAREFDYTAGAEKAFRAFASRTAKRKTISGRPVCCVSAAPTSLT